MRLLSFDASFVPSFLPSFYFRAHACVSLPALSFGRYGPRFMQASEYREKDKQVVWALKKFNGGESHSIMLRATIPNVDRTRQREFGPIRVSFEIPMYVRPSVRS